MSVYLDDPDVTLYCGDALETLRELPSESVHMCVTSPPFFGLRDYGTGSWEGGDESCDHVSHRARNDTTPEALARRAAQSGAGQGAGSQVDTVQFRDVCGRCGARRVDRQIGLEADPSEWVARLVEVFREVRRVLRSDGTCWIECGDSYGANVGGRDRGAETKSGVEGHVPNSWGGRTNMALPRHPFKPKDLIGAPWALAVALRADGWWLRSDIVWARPNPMPESVTDRPTKSHSYVFLLSKSARYFYDADAIREKADEVTRRAETFRNGGPYTDGRSFDNSASSEKDSHGDGALATGRNARSVWTIPTQPLPDEHYAAYPEELVRRCVLAGSPEGGTILDPFLGSGTTALVARKHGRRTIGIELSERYCEIAARRTAQLSLLATGLA